MKKVIRLSKHYQAWKKPRKEIEIKRIVIDKFPYIHFDVHSKLKGKKFVFGVPYNKKEGLAFYTFSKKGNFMHKEIPEKFQKKLERINYPKCPIHKEFMLPTKYFDYMNKKNFQFKCQKCFLTDRRW